MPNANIDYVTSHQGQAHITTQNVIDLIGGLSGDITGIKKFPQLYDGLANEITEALTIQVKTGAALAGGSFFILEEPFDWLLDAGAVGYSRIDILYLVMYEDPETNVQSCDFVYQVGDLYPNGTTGTAPGAPTGTDITATYPFLRMDMTDGSIVSVTDYAVSYLSNSSLVEEVNDLVEQLEQDISGTVEQVNTNTQALNGLRFGIDGQGRYGYKKVGADTVTPFRNPTGNAGQSDVLYGKTFSNASQENVAGTMTNRGAWSDTGTGRSNVTIPAGYHNGGGYVNGIGKWDAGAAAAQAVSWTRYLVTSFHNGGIASGTFDCRNISSLVMGDKSNISDGYSYIAWLNSAGTTLSQTWLSNLSTGATITIPSNATSFRLYVVPSGSGEGGASLLATYVCKILRS